MPLHDYRRFAVGIGEKSTITPEAIRAAFGVWFLDVEFEAVQMKKADDCRELCYQLCEKNPFVETCVGIQGGSVAVIEAGQHTVKMGEWVYIKGPDGIEYRQFITPDPLFIHQQHMRHAHGTPVENELPEQRPPTTVLLGTLLSEGGPVSPRLRYAM